MSGIILTSFHRHLNGKPIKLDKQVHYYQAYWNSPEVKKMIKDEEESRLKAIRDEEKRAKATPEELLILAAKGREIKIVTRCWIRESILMPIIQTECQYWPTWQVGEKLTPCRCFLIRGQV